MDTSTLRASTRLLMFLLLGSLLAACERLGTGPDFSEDGFSVRAHHGHLELTNDTPAPVHYVALEEESSHLVDLYHDPTEWPSVAPGERKRIPYAEVMGYEPGAKRARIHWWAQGRYRTYSVVRLRT